MPKWQHRHRARSCPGYSKIWAGDFRVKIFAACQSYAASVPPLVEPAVRLLTITAPGQDAGLVWDEDLCRSQGDHRHSGTRGCRVAAAPAAAWNKIAPTWWRSLHHDASQATLRRLGRRPTLLIRPWEKQQRGMLHVHPLLGYSTIGERQSADVYLQELISRAPAAGFGFADRKRQISNPIAAAAYIAAYFVAGKKGKMTLRESVTTANMPPSIVYVQPELSQASGITMRSLRLRRWAWKRWRDEVVPHGLDLDVGPLDVWEGLVAGKTLAQIVSAAL